MLLFAFACTVSVATARNVTDTKAKTETSYQVNVPSTDVIAIASDVNSSHIVADAESPKLIRLNPYWSRTRVIRYGENYNSRLLSRACHSLNPPPSLFILS